MEEKKKDRLGSKKNGRVGKKKDVKAKNEMREKVGGGEKKEGEKENWGLRVNRAKKRMQKG